MSLPAALVCLAILIAGVSVILWLWLKSRNDVPNQDTESGSVLVRFRKGYGTGRVGSADQALVSDRARTGLGPSGFDPSRGDVPTVHAKPNTQGGTQDHA